MLSYSMLSYSTHPAHCDSEKHPSHCCHAFTPITQYLIRDAPLDIWGGGGSLKFLLLANFFFYLREKTIFFLTINVRQFLFLCFVEEIFCRKLFLLCRLPFDVFSGQHIFHKFRQQFFFSAHIFNKLFFLTFVATNYFFQTRPLRYQMVRP